MRECSSAGLSYMVACCEWLHGVWDVALPQHKRTKVSLRTHATITRCSKSYQVSACGSRGCKLRPLYWLLMG